MTFVEVVLAGVIAGTCSGVNTIWNNKSNYRDYKQWIHSQIS